MNRIDRVSAILIQLQTKKLVKASEIAERFGISLRTVYRDIKALEEAGVPIGAEAGRGYYIVEGYHLPPVMFTREEAGSIVIAEKLVDKFSDELSRKHFNSATLKIKSVLPMREKEYLEKVNNQVHVLYKSFDGEFPNRFLPDIQQAIAEKKVIRIDYNSISKKEKTENRLIEPMWLCFYSFAWHVIGWCRMRNNYRDFRADRIINLSVLNETFSPRNESPLHEFMHILWKEYDLMEAIIEMDKSTAEIFQNTKYYYGFVEQKDKGNYYEMKFAVNDYDYFAGWLLTLGNKVNIVGPEILLQKVVTITKELCTKYIH
ncbi:MAG: YafY family transcriptional regulator [Bacteroidales bacterium]|nr:YafY family transcriptional regulator [Bacteroidales bacterium]